MIVDNRYDVIVALDEGIRRDLLRAAEAESTSDVRWYSDRLCSISTFSHYLGDEILAGANLKPKPNPTPDPASRQSLMPSCFVSPCPGGLACYPRQVTAAGHLCSRCPRCLCLPSPGSTSKARA